MTVTEATIRSRTQPVTVDLYRDIHKGIRAELFAVTADAGRIDPASGAARAAVAGHVRALVEVLESHAGHEDTVVQPVLEQYAPALADRIRADHERFDVRTGELVAFADEMADSPRAERAEAVRNLYLELAEFTGAYLLHQDVEDRTVVPTLERVIGPDAVLGLKMRIVASIPPPELATSLAFMLPAMNIDNRAELLGGVRAGAPAQVFEGIWGLAGSVLTAADCADLGERLGL
jgi:hypothetical protein